MNQLLLDQNAVLILHATFKDIASLRLGSNGRSVGDERYGSAYFSPVEKTYRSNELKHKSDQIRSIPDQYIASSSSPSNVYDGNSRKGRTFLSTISFGKVG